MAPAWCRRLGPRQGVTCHPLRALRPPALPCCQQALRGSVPGHTCRVASGSRVWAGVGSRAQGSLELRAEDAAGRRRPGAGQPQPPVPNAARAQAPTERGPDLQGCPGTGSSGLARSNGPKGHTGQDRARQTPAVGGGGGRDLPVSPSGVRPSLHPQSPVTPRATASGTAHSSPVSASPSRLRAGRVAGPRGRGHLRGGAPGFSLPTRGFSAGCCEAVLWTRKVGVPVQVTPRGAGSSHRLAAGPHTRWAARQPSSQPPPPQPTPHRRLRLGAQAGAVWGWGQRGPGRARAGVMRQVVTLPPRGRASPEEPDGTAGSDQVQVPISSPGTQSSGEAETWCGHPCASQEGVGGTGGSARGQEGTAPHFPTRTCPEQSPLPGPRCPLLPTPLSWAQAWPTASAPRARR